MKLKIKPTHTTIILTAMIIVFVSGCGFKLRNQQSSIHTNNTTTAVNGANTNNTSNINNPVSQTVFIKYFNKNKETTALMSALQLELNRLGVQTDKVFDSKSGTNTINKKSLDSVPMVIIKDIKFYDYKLLGLLTEVRVVLVAKVSYQLPNNDKVITGQPIQVARTYQYNQASVSFEDKQGKQVRSWLYQELAERISEQVLALSNATIKDTNKDMQP